MQKTLFIIRHGKSSWEAEVGDIDRPLTERGVRNAYDMATRLVKVNLIPEQIYTSTAARALHTATIMARVWELPEVAFSLRESLYMCGSAEINELLAEIPDELSAVAIYGHNPIFTELANQFLSTAIDNIPTAGVVVLTIETNSWTELRSGTVVEEVVDFPKK